MTQENKLTPGELLELVRGLKELGVCKGKIEGLEFEFAPELPVEGNVQFLTPEEYETKAKEIRKKLNEELFEAS